MNEINGAFFTPDSKERIEIGDYYYFDGTLSHEYQTSKVCVGIVFSVNIFAKEKERGFHGYVVALKDAVDEHGNLLHLWRNVENLKTSCINIERNSRIKYNHENLRVDNGGLFYSENFQNDEYVAINVARNYSVELPVNKTSGWYLPSSGQMWQILIRFIMNDNLNEQLKLLNLGNEYMVSQIREEIYPLSLSLEKQEFLYGNPADAFLVRPIFTF